jgi:hypothetical protein
MTSSTKGKNGMNDGVAMLIERMKTNPEEFVSEHGSSKWGSLIASYKEFLEPEDQQALTEGMKVVLQQRFTQKVMEELVDPAEESSIRQLGKLMRKQREAGLGQTPIAGVTQTL